MFSRWETFEDILLRHIDLGFSHSKSLKVEPCQNTKGQLPLLRLAGGKRIDRRPYVAYSRGILHFFDTRYILIEIIGILLRNSSLMTPNHDIISILAGCVNDP